MFFSQLYRYLYRPTAQSIAKHKKSHGMRKSEHIFLAACHKFSSYCKSQSMTRAFLALDLFRFCRILRHVGKIMLLIVVGLSFMIAYSSVSAALAPGFKSPSLSIRALSVLGLLIYTAIVGMMLWSYLAAFATDPGGVPQGWTPFASDLEVGHEGYHCHLHAITSVNARSMPRPRPPPPKLCCSRASRSKRR